MAVQLESRLEGKAPVLEGGTQVSFTELSV